MSRVEPGIVDGLTPSQREAVQTVEGPLLILAGPGSGKTRVVTHRIAHMLSQGIPANQILALTFTNKAADEMRRRLSKLAPGQSVWMGTFHRFCAQLLRIHGRLVGLAENYTIYDRDDASTALQTAITQSGVSLSQVTASQIAGEISRAKNLAISPEDYASDGDPLANIVGRIYPEYQRRLLAENAADFDDLLLHVADLLHREPELRATLDARYRYILVDEYQDTNRAQFAIIRGLATDFPNLAVTGDPDQSIYGWRGADIRNILDFETYYPQARLVRLEQNYRSTKSILLVADQLIANNACRKEKVLHTDNPGGSPVRLTVLVDGPEEADVIAARIANEIRGGKRAPSDFAIFYRTNAMSRILERSLRAVSVPYQIVRGLEFYQRKEIKDVLAYLQILNNPRCDAAFRRIINTPGRGIGRTTLRHLERNAQEQGISLLESARKCGLIESIKKRASVSLATFVALIDRLTLSITDSVESIVSRVLDESGYRQMLAESADPSDQERLENIEELITDAAEFDQQHGDQATLEAFLEHAVLVADIDDWDVQADRVSLMTLHAAKGLEFPVVFIVAVEEGILPHEQSKQEDRLEEERRLLFVGITRAKEELHLSMARQRFYRGRTRFTIPSPFLMELPREHMEVIAPHQFFERVNTSESDVEFFFDDEPTFAAPRERRKPSFDPSELSAKMKTAAQLMPAEKGSQPNPATEDFRPGMIVNHPQYGLGKILRLSGSGAKRTAVVRFFGTAGEKTFRLAFSPLEAVGSE